MSVSSSTPRRCQHQAGTGDHPAGDGQRAQHPGPVPVPGHLLTALARQARSDQAAEVLGVLDDAVARLRAIVD